MLRRTPRVYGNSPGSPRSRSYSTGSVFDGLKSFGSGMPEEVSKCSRRSPRPAGASVFVLIRILLGVQVSTARCKRAVLTCILLLNRSLAHAGRGGNERFLFTTGGGSVCVNASPT